MSATARGPLWGDIPIEIIGLTGEYASGKTLFMINANAADPKTTLIFDEEKSSSSYAWMGFNRVSIQDEVIRKYPDGARPMYYFLWWLDYLRKEVKPGQYRVIGLDTVQVIEEGLAEFVGKNPSMFGKTAAQYAKMESLFWGDVKAYWKSVLNEIAAKCETFIFTSHLRDEWQGGKPTGRRKPKGKETLMELASLYLMMERKRNEKGEVPSIPSAIVLKSRLVTARRNSDGSIWIDPETGDPKQIPVLPPRLPKATPGEIRRYIKNPPNYDKLQAEETIPEERISEIELLRSKERTEEARRDTALLELERIEKQKELMQLAQARQQSDSSPAANESESTSSAEPVKAVSVDPAIKPFPKAITPGQVNDLKDTYKSLIALNEPYLFDEFMRSNYHVELVKDLTSDQAEEMIESMRAKLDTLRMEQQANSK